MAYGDIGSESISLRDTLAGQAMAAMWAGYSLLTAAKPDSAPEWPSNEEIASDAYELADAMLAARKEGK